MTRRYRKCPLAGESAARAINRDLSDELSRVEDKLTQVFSTRAQSVDQGGGAENGTTLLASFARVRQHHLYERLMETVCKHGKYFEGEDSA